MHILHTVLYTFPEVLTRRICSSIRACLVSELFLYSPDFNVLLRGVTVRRN